MPNKYIITATGISSGKYYLQLKKGASYQDSNISLLEASVEKRDRGQVASNNMEAYYPVTRFSFVIKDLTNDTQVTFVGNDYTLEAHILDKKTGLLRKCQPHIESSTETVDYYPVWTML